MTKPGWQPLCDAPEDVDVLMAAKPEGHIRWKYGVASISAGGILFDWPWTFRPSLFRLIEEPTDER